VSIFFYGRVLRIEYSKFVFWPTRKIPIAGKQPLIISMQMWLSPQSQG